MKPHPKKEKKRSSLPWVVFIIILMIGSTIGYVFSGLQNDNKQNSDLVYNGYTFTQTESGWTFLYNNKIIYVDYLPDEVKDIPLESFPLGNSKVYLVYKPSEKDNNIDYSLRKVYSVLRGNGFNTFLACSDEQDCPDIPIVDCENSLSPIVLFKKEDLLKTSINGKCLVLEGDAIGLSKASDRFIYSVLGVI